MSRGAHERAADVRNLLRAAGAVYEKRATIAPEIAQFTGLSPEGVELGFQSLERDATEAEIETLVAGAGNRAHVHVILAANVFVAPLRALAIARASAARVTIRPSPRDPTLTRALVDEAGDPSIALTSERDVARIGTDEIHVYGRTDTVAAVRARARRGVAVHGHAAGMGIAWVTAPANLYDAAESLSEDVIAFDQRGCQSPRIAMVEGDEERAYTFARTLCEAMSARADRVPRGRLTGEERAEATRWRDAMAFAGHLWSGRDSSVAVAHPGTPIFVPPPGRHVQVVSEPDAISTTARLVSIAPFIVAVGTDDPRHVAAMAPAHARVSRLGQMQRPPLDGPVDRRSTA